MVVVDLTGTYQLFWLQNWNRLNCMIEMKTQMQKSRNTLPGLNKKEKSIKSCSKSTPQQLNQTEQYSPHSTTTENSQT